ncbi:hypothetical protein FSP39_010413 [Pinctada imbricata]|uniref:Uncharacterized protein n=1 Tax=Pinctada imbricata TaxID=66713 RepID=A0AA88XCT8_PINIB|nr:hypothetical protein FSP39_010413 [Pinctada imbricata]
MDTGDQTCSLDDFSHWKIEALRSFLVCRGLTCTGTKQELIALSFAAHTMKMPVLPTVLEQEKSKKDAYQNLLVVDQNRLPDPMAIFDKWEDEKQGMKSWPPVFITDVTAFLMKTENEERAQEYLNQYKIGKAYEYFTSEWLKEMYYHPISSTSPYCFLRARCTPSQRLNAGSHSVWICCEKKSGSVKSAFCSCTSGLGQTCNHVAGLLFRIEAANKLGVTSCTSLPCLWIKPSENKLQPNKIKNMDFKKSIHGKIRTRPLVGRSKADFQVLPQPVSSEDERTIQNELLKSLCHVVPNACVFKGLRNTVHETATRSGEILEEEEVNVIDINNYHQETMVRNNVECITDAEVESISKITLGQSSNSQWKEIRKGKITASNFYSVHTKVNSCKKKSACDVKPILCNIMGYTDVNPNIKSLKYGREMEKVAKRNFIKVYRKKHKNVSFDECGIYLDKERPFLAATPDLLVRCSCCGEGLVELKCPLIPKCDSCLSFCMCNLPSCLRKSDRLPKLKHTTSYYGQIQGQLAITGRKWCILYIYTCNGSYDEQITFDRDFYSEMLANLDFFYYSFVLPEIKSRSLRTMMQQVSCNSADTPEPMEVDDHQDGDTYFCPHCNFKVANEVIDIKDRSICCDSCKLWYHFSCVGITNKNLKSLPSWHCRKCMES